MDKVYIVTGANRGLGEAFIDQVLIEANTCAVSISRKITSKQNNYLVIGKLIFIEQDLADKINYTKLNKLTNIIDNKTEIIFISNAGTIHPLDVVSKLQDQDVINAVNINVISPVFIIKYLLKQFSNNKIMCVNITSGAANRSISSWAIYSATKAFTNRFFEILKEENAANKNFSFLSIDPGLVDTGMQATVRSSVFPLRHVFEEAKQNGKLITSTEAAKKILAQL